MFHTKNESDSDRSRGAGDALAAVPEVVVQSVDVSIVVPVLDEEESIGELVQRIRQGIESTSKTYEIVFVDDGSRDATAERIRELHAVDPRVKLVRFRRNFGKAAALSAGFEAAGGTLIITIDGDLQDEPREIPRFIEELESRDLDLVSGWKRRRRDPLSKRFPSLVWNRVLRAVAGVDLHDFNCGFKCYRREVLDEVSVYGELHRYIPVLASRRGFRIGEIEVEHHARRFGRSKYGWDRIYKGLLDLLTVLFITRYTRRPLHLFGGIGAVFAVGGSLICAYLAVLWFFGEPLSRRPLLLLGVLLILLGLQILTTGLLGEMITYKSFQRRDSYSVRESLLD